MAYSAKKAQQSQEENKQMIEDAINSIKNYTQTPEDVKELADFMAQFPQYSTNNQLLIQNQYRGATATAGYQQFKKLGYTVRKGEKAIRILAPQKQEYIIPEDGSAWIPKPKWTREQKRQVKNNEVKTYSKSWFKRVSVFDISQTDMPIEEAPKLLPNRLYSFDMTNVKDESKLYQALLNVAKSKNISVQVASTESASKGYAYQNPNGKIGIVLSDRLDASNRIPTLIHEMTHALIHFDNQHKEMEVSKKEFQAEFSSYITSKSFGIDTSEKAIPYIAGWTDRLNELSNKDLVNLLEDTQKISRNIIRLTNNEWERQNQVRQQEDMVHHVESESFEQEERVVQQEEWENIKVNTEFKGHQFQYNIQVNRVDYQIRGTYQRDQETPKEATEKSCLNAIQYVLKNHELDDPMTHTLNKAIEEAKNRQERTKLYQENQQRIDIIDSQHSSHKSERSNESKPLRFDEKIKMARQVNILAVAEAYGIHLTKDSRDQYRDADNHSMVFTPSKNTFYENNGSFGGDPITFAQKVMGIDSFKEAVNYLVSGDYGQIDIVPQEKKPFQYDASKEVKHFDKARSYLVNERCIHPNLVDALHEKGYIRQDKRNNVLFLWNEKGRIVGCVEQGTVKMNKLINGRDHWKAIQKNSESYNGYAFNFSNGEPKHLKFFESDIDALSYASIHGLEKDTQYVAMDGLKDNVIAHYAQEAMQRTHHHVESIQLCVDNDEAGRKFAEKYDYLKQDEQPIKVELNVPDIPNELNNQTEKWDWNNECQYRHYQNQPSTFQTLEEFGIQPQLIQFLKEEKFVTENWKHELTFNWNENGEKVGETVCDSRLQVIERTKGSQGFNLQNGQIKTLKCFESPIEMMSYLSLHSLEENTSYVSLDGQNRSIIDHYVSQNPTIQHVEVCVADKDRVNQFASEIYPSLKDSTIRLSTTTCETSFLSKCQRHCEAQSTITQDRGDLEQ